ncbi:MAG: hypothetical protein L0027_15185, partial [Candidatus Rokubacteria bacterium]|nr:hypothetical protein [Candidatus Rokubacteria bacterium]
GHKVRLGATVYLVERPLRVQGDAAQQVLYRFLELGARPGPDALEIREAPGGAVLELSADGVLQEDWTDASLLRSIQEGVAEPLVRYGLTVRAVEPVALDLEGPSKELVYNPTYEGGEDVKVVGYDESGAPIYGVDYANVIEEGAKEGLENFGEAAGDVVAGAGAAASQGLLGLLKGLGVLGSILLVLVLLVAVYVFVKGLV